MHRITSFPSIDLNKNAKTNTLDPNKLFCFIMPNLEEACFLFIFPTKKSAKNAIVESSIVPFFENQTNEQTYRDATLEAQFWGEQYGIKIHLIKEGIPFLTLNSGEIVDSMPNIRGSSDKRVIQKVLYEEKIGYIVLLEYMNFIPVTEQTLEKLKNGDFKINFNHRTVF
jgi:hypothetical protein